MIMNRLPMPTCVLAVVCFANAPAHAEQPLFKQGTWDLELTGSYTTPIRFSVEDVVSGEVGVGYYLFDNFSVNVDFAGVAIDQFGDDARGGAVTVMLRWHIFQSHGLSLFVDGGGGRMWLDEASPPGGTTYNWVARVGGGLTFKLADHWHLLGGARYFHYSNGDVHGRDQNPTYDGVQFFGGIMYAF